jgi:hypothetical protein
MKILLKTLNPCFFSLLIFSFAACGNDDRSNDNFDINEISGESITLKNTEENTLIKNDIYNLKLYLVDSDRNRIYYKENVDYIATQNKLRRTTNSSIPNFKDHKVIFNNDSTFTFNSVPRNPSLTISYHIYADYNFYDTEYIAGQFDKGFLSTRLKNKLKNKKQINISAFGTSITAGAHTLEDFHHNSDIETYPYLVAKGLKKVWGSNVVVTNYSKNGGYLKSLSDFLPTMIQGENDIVFIEFGMNDHIGSDWEKNLLVFNMYLEEIMIKFQEKNVDVILIGFPQQNSRWDMEYKGSTIAYNKSLANFAKKYSCSFIDIYSNFSKYDQTKINNDLYGDFMHHPSSFGHILYYKSIMPLFITKDVSDGYVYSLLD